MFEIRIFAIYDKVAKKQVDHFLCENVESAKRLICDIYIYNKLNNIAKFPSDFEVYELLPEFYSKYPSTSDFSKSFVLSFDVESVLREKGVFNVESK